MANPPAAKRRSYRAFFLVVFLFVLAGGAYFAFRKFTGLELEHAPLANVPKDSVLVGYFRFGPLVRSETLKLIVDPAEIEARLQRFRERCQLDPAEQLEDVIVFSQGTTVDSLTDLGAIARGPFDHEKLRTCFQQAFENDGLGEIRVGEIDGVPAVFPADSDQRAAFLGRRAIAMGKEPVVRKIIDVVRDGEDAASADPVFSRVWTRLGTGQDIVLVGRVLPAVRETLREVLNAPAGARFRSYVDKVEAVGVSAAVTEGLDLALVLAMQDAAAATQVVAAVTTEVESLKNNMMISMTPFGAIVRAIRIDDQGNDVLVTVDVPHQRLVQAIEFAQNYLSFLGDGRGPRPDATPPPPDSVIPGQPAPAPTAAP